MRHRLATLTAFTLGILWVVLSALFAYMQSQ